MGKAKLYTVELTATETSPGVFDFDVQSATGLQHNKSNGKDKFIFNKKTNKLTRDDYYLVQYVLTNGAAHGLSFPQDLADAMLVCRVADEQQAYATCQTAACPVVDELKAIARLDDTTLLVLNRDSAVEWFVFTLNFVKAGQPGFVQWDPIDENRNGHSLYA